MGMKQIRTAALSRHIASPFVRLDGLELLQLRKLPNLAFRLFIELLNLDRLNTGRIETSYAVLLALLDFDQAPGAHASDKPTVQRVRTALDTLAAMQLVRIDRIKNEKAKGLFLRVTPRTSLSASKDGINRRSNRPEKAAKPASMRPRAIHQLGEQQTEQQGIQDEVFPSISPTIHRPEGVPSAVAERLDSVRRSVARGGRKAGPQGGQNVARSARTPPGAAPPVSPQGDPFTPEQPPTERRGGDSPATMKPIGALLP